MTTMQNLISYASSLIEDTSQADNPEYIRGVLEIVAGIIGVSSDYLCGVEALLRQPTDWHREALVDLLIEVRG